jgi:hypothetical protein
MHYPVLPALIAGSAVPGVASVLGQAPVDTVGWLMQLGPSAMAAVVAWVALVYVRKRDEDQKSTMERQDALITKLSDRQVAMNDKFEASLDRVVNKMDGAIRDLGQTNSNGLASLSQAIQTVILTVGQFQASQAEMITKLHSMESDVGLLARIAGLRKAESEEDEKDGGGRSDSKQITKPARLPRGNTPPRGE